MTSGTNTTTHPALVFFSSCCIQFLLQRVVQVVAIAAELITSLEILHEQ